jgi:acyl dehydratase
MPIFYPDILQQTTPARKFTYGQRDVMLYALSIGLGADPLDERELPFVYENALKVVPTAATVLSMDARDGQRSPEVPAGLRLSTLDMNKVLHGEQAIELHRPLPPTGTFYVTSRVVGAYDKGAKKGAIVIKETTWTGEQGVAVATLTHSAFARGDGGFGGPSVGAPEPHPNPARAPDFSVDIPTRPDQALLYRLNGDYNALHADPATAAQSGFPKPILHGLCTYGLTCRAVLQTIADYDSNAILSHQVRLSAPVFPGETVTVDLWQDGRVVSFEARVKARDTVVIRNGKTVLR